MTTEPATPDDPREQIVVHGRAKAAELPDLTAEQVAAIKPVLGPALVEVRRRPAKPTKDDSGAG